MFRKTCNVSPSKLTDDDYIRKFRLKSFYIKLDKISENPTEEDSKKQNYNLCSVNIPKLSTNCNCGCDGIDEEYYKKLYNIQDCQIALSKITASKTNKRKFPAIYDTQYASTEQDYCKKYKCQDFSIKLSPILAGSEKTRAKDSTVEANTNSNSMHTMKSFVIQLKKFVMEEKVVVHKLNYGEYKTVNKIKDFTIKLIKIQPFNPVNKFGLKNFSIVLPKLSVNMYNSSFGKISSIDELMLRR